MNKIRLTKQFTFEMAHALHNYDGKCKNIHGHSYILYVTVQGEPIKDETHNNQGMVMDFSELKKIVNEKICNRFDHSIILNNKSPLPDIKKFGELFKKHDFVDYQPTCENMVLHFVEIIKQELPKNVALAYIRLHETASSYAEWYAEDNT